MKKKSIDILLLVSFVFVILLVILIGFVDKQFNPLTASYIGLYSLNKLFLIDSNKTIWNIIADVIFIIALLIIIISVLLFLYKFFLKHKNDKLILTFCAILFCLFGVWVLFDKIIIFNYRPLLINGEKESSFPSTHVMIVTYVMLWMMFLINTKIKKSFIKEILQFICLIMIIVTAIARVVSTMHWFTDVLGGILIGLFFFLLFLKYYLKSDVLGDE